MTPENRARLLKVLRRLQQPSSLAGFASLAVLVHVSAPQFAAATDLIGIIAGLLAVYFDDGSSVTAETTAEIGGRTYAYLQNSVVAGNSAAAVSLHASGAASSVEVAADMIRVGNRTGSAIGTDNSSPTTTTEN